MAGSLRTLSALFALSRGTQASLSVAQPLIALLLADAGPPPQRVAVATTAAFAGFFALFAVNDVLDVDVDRRRFAHVRPYEGTDLDGVGGRHPLARGRLSRGAALAWIVALGTVTVALTALLGGFCLLLLAVAALLQVLYCRLATVTTYKFLISGVMVAIGGSIGWFAVSGVVDPLRLGLFAVWMVAWEIGGRNVPNDLADVEEDRHLGVRTLPVVHGVRAGAAVAFGFLVAAGAAGIALACVAYDSFGAPGLAGTVLVSVVTAFRPAVVLLRRAEPPVALAVFNRASFQPVGVLAAFLAGLAVTG
ncbi:UbiA family prenyltransferase [Streptomyces sp. CRN 30]|uniref:UbiA family prenyltransferase n=1 Tax=Streptomyces sp. CRN 30 TaxID=3075613 RepID=UPI002A837815|nr:UbiA family prenyltransferase [Streptomyces sp. CRN 30]